jgi:hypothetical protein
MNIPDRDPDFVNANNVKWWRLPEFESDVHKSEGMNTYYLFLTQHDDGCLSYVLIDSISNEIKHVEENIKFGLSSVEAFIAKAKFNKLGGQEINGVEMDFVILQRDALKVLLGLHGIADGLSSSHSFNRALVASSQMLNRSLSNSVELLVDKLPVTRLFGKFASAHIDSLTAEVCMLHDRSMRYRYAVENIAALVLPPGTYENIRNEPEKLIAAVRTIRDQWFASLNTLDNEPKQITNEEDDAR